MEPFPKSAMADAFASASAEEQVELKREYAIRQREAEMKKKQDEEQEKKNAIKQQKVREEEKLREQRQMEVQQGYSKQQMMKRTAQMENEYRERCREAQITKKRNAWLTRQNQQIQEMLDEYQVEEDDLLDKKMEAKERKNRLRHEEMDKRLFMVHQAKNIEQQREAKELEREEDRKEKSIHRIDTLKAELDAEIDEYIEHPTHIPLKQALCGGLRSVPTVTALLAALRDQREDLNDLKATNLEQRAKALGKPLFHMVRQMKEGHENARIKPPEPEVDEKKANKKKNTAQQEGKR